MKSEERHRLQEHDLQKLTAHAGEYWQRYGNYVLIGFLAVCLAAAVTIYLVNRFGAQASAGWTELRASATAEDFANVAEDFSGTVVGAWARLQEAEAHLQSGIRLSFADRPAARDDLTEAREAFEKTLANQAAPPQVRERALYGLARTLETLAGIQTAEQDDSATKPAASLNEAIDAYEQLLKQFPETLYKDIAQERIAELKRQSTQEFYAWFRTQNPRPGDRRLPQDGLLPPGHPALGDFSLPGAPEDAAPPRPVPGGGVELPPPTTPTPPDADPRRRLMQDQAYDPDGPVEAPLPGPERTEPPPVLVDPAPDAPAEEPSSAQPQQ